MAWHFPGHNYLGPGTHNFHKKPIDDDDVIAQHHDWAYKMSWTPHDVRIADQDAIYLFRKCRGWHSTVAWVCLSVKYTVEGVTGVIYPRRLA